ncbi:MAG: formate dehydrogenase accessory sulfurtransferase FdhD [Microscillaceae bacterium]|nr:formate dehydrogenase accessory sulfurtransferase FdhD [Microscillaceae bacterium]
MPQPTVYPLEVKKVLKNLSFVKQTDLLVVEEPLEIRLGFGTADNRQQKSISLTMRTPGNDFELSLGFLFTEGILTSINQLHSIRYCENISSEDSKENIVRVELKEGFTPDLKTLERHFYTHSSCGVCGKASLESLSTLNCPINLPSYPLVSTECILQLAENIREEQTVFKHTGGLHAAAIFSPEGELLLLREDIGRHNALDKLIGHFLYQNQLPLSHHILWLSGRVSFEMVQKALKAGIAVLVAVGAPSSLAVDLATQYQMTLIGFAKEQSFNIYSDFGRVIHFTSSKI